MKDFEVEYESNHIVAYNKLLFENFASDLFDPIYLQTNGLLSEPIAGGLQGRGAVQYFKYCDIELVLRHYYRGGLPAKISSDQYLWTGYEQTRVYRELDILAELRSKKLPVPQPAAARVIKHGFRYQADIITVRVKDAQTLGEILSIHTLNDQSWRDIGKVIKKFHLQNCNHADLNANNILIDKNNEIFLIDFDRSKIDSSNNSWKENNLLRLRRSLEKLDKIKQKFHYSDDNFLMLQNSYIES